MQGYSVSARDMGGFSYEVSNGRGVVHTAWHPEAGKFLATELFLASLGTCMLATMMAAAEGRGIDLAGATVRVDCDAETKPDRMTNIRVTYALPAGLSEAQKASLIRAGNRCKVHNTIEAHSRFETIIQDL